MKKLIYGFAIIAGLISCNDDYTDWASPQHADSKTPIEVTLTVSAPSAIDVASITEDSTIVFVADLNAPEGSSTTEYSLKLNNEQVLPVSLEGKASVDELNKAVIALCGKENIAQTLNASLDADVYVNGISIRVSTTYQLTVTPYITPEYFVVGTVQNWIATDMTCMLYPETDNIHSYTALWTGAWDLKIWQAVDFGNWDSAYGCSVDGDNAPSGTLIQESAQSISAPTAEYYTFTIDMENMTYSWTRLDNQNPTEYSSISLIGDFNSWDESGSEVQLQQINAHNWYVDKVSLSGGTKLRANNKWDVNWGAAVNIGDQPHAVCVINGDNMNVPEGEYSVFFNDITGTVIFRTVE